MAILTSFRSDNQRTKDLRQAVLTGVLFALAMPPMKTGFFAYFALAPFFFLLEGKEGGEARRWGYLTGLVIALFTLSWIAWATVAGLFGVLLIWPLYIMLFAWTFSFVRKHTGVYAYAAAPFLWVTIEYIQSLSELAFPWNHLGYTQTFCLPLIQYAEYTSVYGVSFWAALLNVLFFLAVRYPQVRKPSLFAATALWIAAFLYGLVAMNLQYGSDERPSLSVAMIQANLDPNEKWSPDLYENNFSLYEELTAQVIDRQPDLIIWPETAVPFYLRSEPSYLARIHRLIDPIKATLLTGALDYQYLEDGSYVYFNAALLVEPNRPGLQHHHKMKLVPFSERVPYKLHFPFNALKKVLWNFGLGDYALGKEPSVLDGPLYSKEGSLAGRFRCGTAICYESVFAEHVRRYVLNGAEFLVIITNDAWFGRTQAPFQHNQIAVFRAVENRRDIARCANTGISCFIDRCGRMRNATKIYTEATVFDRLGRSQELTFFTRHGHLFVFASMIVTAAVLLLAGIKAVIKR